MRLGDRVAEVPVDDAVRASVSYDQLRIGDDGLFWLETRPDAGGGTTVTQWRSGEGKRDVSPKGFDVASGLHAYGGGSFAVAEGRCGASAEMASTGAVVAATNSNWSLMGPSVT